MAKFIKAFQDGTSRIFLSISEAAKALNIDASNIGKVLRGKRSRAGGFSFVYTLEKPQSSKAKATLKAAAQRVEKKEAVQAVHDRLAEINQRYTNAKKADTLEGDPVLKKLMSHTDYFGSTKAGKYRISSAHLSQYTTEELQNFLRILASEESKYVELAKKKGRGHGKAQLAAILGISQKQVQEYDDLIPAMFELVRLAKEALFFRYSQFRDTLFETLQDGIDHELLGDYLDMIYNAYLGNDSDALGEILSAMENIDDEFRDDYS